MAFTFGKQATPAGFGSPAGGGATFGTGAGGGGGFGSFGATTGAGRGFGGATTTPAFGAGGAAPNAPPAAGRGGFSFGGMSPAAATPSSAFSFGGGAAGGAGRGFDFGSTPTTGGFGFGGGAAGGGAGGAGRGLFGAATTPGAFGFGGAQQQQQQQQATQPGGFTFGGAGAAGANPQQLMKQMQDQLAAQHALMAATGAGGQPSAFDELEAIVRAYDPSAGDAYRFRFMLYNLVDAAVARNYVKPPHLADWVWRQAVRENPDPERMVPVVANGFEDLARRVEAQDKAIEEHETAVEAVTEMATRLRTRHETSTVARVAAYRRTHAQLERRLLCVMRRVAVLAGRVQAQQRHALGVMAAGGGVTADEERLWAKLDALRRALALPAHQRARLADMLARARLHGDGATAAASVASHLPPLAASSVAELASLLATMSDALGVVTRRLRVDERRLNTLLAHSEELDKYSLH